jgi:hypothetical protein
LRSASGEDDSDGILSTLQFKQGFCRGAGGGLTGCVTGGVNLD